MPPGYSLTAAKCSSPCRTNRKRLSDTPRTVPTSGSQFFATKRKTVLCWSQSPTHTCIPICSFSHSVGKTKLLECSVQSPFKRQSHCTSSVSFRHKIRKYTAVFTAFINDNTAVMDPQSHCNYTSCIHWGDQCNSVHIQSQPAYCQRTGYC